MVVFALTGKLSQPRAAIVAMIEKAGHQVATSLTSAVDYLVQGKLPPNMATTNKLEKSAARGVTIISESKLRSMLRGNTNSASAATTPSRSLVSKRASPSRQGTTYTSPSSSVYTSTHASTSSRSRTSTHKSPRANIFLAPKHVARSPLRPTKNASSSSSTMKQTGTGAHAGGKKPARQETPLHAAKIGEQYVIAALQKLGQFAKHLQRRNKADLGLAIDDIVEKAMKLTSNRASNNLGGSMEHAYIAGVKAFNANGNRLLRNMDADELIRRAIGVINTASPTVDSMVRLSANSTTTHKRILKLALFFKQIELLLRSARFSAMRQYMLMEN